MKNILYFYTLYILVENNNQIDPLDYLTSQLSAYNESEQEALEQMDHKISAPVKILLDESGNRLPIFLKQNDENLDNSEFYVD